MKNALFLIVIITVGIASSWGQNAPNAANNGPANGTYNATGTITFTAGGIKYSCSISKVIAASTSITIQTSKADVKTNGSLIITCYTAKSAITTGVYSASSSGTISSVTFIDKTVTPFTATAMTTGSNCSVNITLLTSKIIKGTFTATVLKPLDNTKLSITDGMIDCCISQFK